MRHIAAHSTRIGATQALGESGASLLDLMQDGGWKSPNMPVQYLRQLAIRRGGMAQWSRERQRLNPDGERHDEPARRDSLFRAENLEGATVGPSGLPGQ